MGIPFPSDLPTIPPDIFNSDNYLPYNIGNYIGLSIWVILIIAIVSIGVAVGLAFIPATIARNKGYSYGGFWVFGFFLFLIALIVALCLPDKRAQYPPQYQQPYGQPYGQPYQQPYGQPYQQPPSAQPRGFCTNCGSPITADAAYCSKCGAKL